MNGLRSRILVHVIGLCLIVDLGCAARKETKRMYATPEHTRIRLKERCLLDAEGRPDKHCILIWNLDAVEVEQ